MEYYKYRDEDAMENGVTYTETDEEGWPYRLLTVGNGATISSNINHPKWGSVLGEGAIIIDESDEFFAASKISQEEFNAVWHQHLAQHQPQWERAKARFPVGKSIVGAMLIFFPQGVLVDLGPNAVGIADYAQCKASTRPEWMYTGHKITAIVAGYDEDNQWIELQEPQVLEETVKAKRRRQ